MSAVAGWLDDATRIIPVRPGSTGQILALGRTTRLFTERQRLAMIARDQGCSFPGCDVGPQWTQAHHVLAWQNGGRTDVANGTLLCRYHHAHFEHLGWSCTMSSGLPEWIPPPWTDPQQQPRRNHAHDPTATLRHRLVSSRVGQQRTTPNTAADP